MKDTSGPNIDDAMSRSEARLQVGTENVDAATSGPAISEEEHEVTLHAERSVVDKQTVPARQEMKVAISEQNNSKQRYRSGVAASDGPGR